jgi:FixJ family two-component response regulator
MGKLLPFVSDVPVFVVDDDSSVRETLVLLLKIEGYAAQGFSDGASFLEEVRSASPACVILDLHLPGESGFQVLRRLAAEKVASPILVISGAADIAMAVEAMKHGALDFLEKPFSSDAIVDRVRTAVKVWRETRGSESDGLASFPGRQLLTSREREVLSQVARGASNKEAGRRLGISPRTVEVHRARIMDKLGAKNTADLIRIVFSEASSRRQLSAS